ncbi:MAG TPA: hypothetical protein VGF28_14880 [Thermoanaerobaculia bacterium]|jgi:hypothetical protein
MVDFFLQLVMLAAIADAPPAACAPVSAALAEIHRLDWTVVSEADLIRAVPLNLRIVWESEEDADCNRHRYVSDSEEQSSRTFWARFESRLIGGRCMSELTSITYWCDFADPRDAGQFRQHVIELLQVGGDASGAGNSRDFAWRGGDSETRFNLFTDVRKVGSNFRASARLTHSPITAAEAEKLPLERSRHARDR